MTLTDLLKSKEEGNIPRDAVVLTFDDGYADFYENAFPILNDAKVPVTLFLTTGFVDNDTWLWPDMIRYAIGRSLKRVLEISAFDKSFDIASNPEASWSSIADYCLTVSNIKKMEIINEIFTKLEVSLPTAAPEGYRPLTWNQIRKMVSRGLDVGSHSVTHPVLTQLESQHLMNELNASKRKIERELGKKIEIFCYPNGQKGDYNIEVKNAIKDCGYRYAVAAFSGSDPLSDRLEIKRYPASYTIEGFIKNIYGLTLVSMKSRHFS